MRKCSKRSSVWAIRQCLEGKTPKTESLGVKRPGGETTMCMGRIIQGETSRGKMSSRRKVQAGGEMASSQNIHNIVSINHTLATSVLSQPCMMRSPCKMVEIVGTGFQLWSTHCHQCRRDVFVLHGLLWYGYSSGLIAKCAWLGWPMI